jgi:DNA-binding CsgD family transcriptional regulator
MEPKIKVEQESNVVFNLDNNTQLEFLNSRKTVVIIDKDRFLVCKQLMLENAEDQDFANYLNIPLPTVRFFKHKLQIFEDSIRAKRRAARLSAQRRKKARPAMRKREISSEERYKRARELIGKNYSTNQISKILKISERSVTRFKKRIREEKTRLKAEGKIPTIPNDPDDENSFKYLAMNEKVERAKELFRKRLKIGEISELLNISERSVRRWKDRLTKMETEPEKYQAPAEKTRTIVQDKDDDTSEDAKPKRKRRTYLDKEKVQYATELIENGLSNKEMSMLLEMSIACVRKLKMKIIDGTVHELIDDSEEHFKRLNGASSSKDADVKLENNDPLNVLHEYTTLPTAASQRSSHERKPKVTLSDRDMFVVRLLRDNSIRTMDIAKMLSISERSVTRLLAKTKDKTVLDYEPDVVEEVQRLLAAKDNILNEVIEEYDDPNVTMVYDDSKEDLAIRLLEMNTKVSDHFSNVFASGS